MKNKFLGTALFCIALVAMVAAGKYFFIVADEAESTKIIDSTKQQLMELEAPVVSRATINRRECITWEAMEEVQGYDIYTAKKKNGKYKLVGTTKKNFYKLNKLGRGYFGYVKVIPYTKVENTKINGNGSTPLRLLTNVKVTNVRPTAAGTVTVTWNAGQNVSGYIIQYSKNEDFSNKSKIMINNPEQTAINIYDLDAGQTYYFRVRAYKQKKKKHYSLFSNVKKVKVLSVSDIANGKSRKTYGYFEDSLFIGDSVLQGLQIYLNSKGGNYLDGAKAKGVISYSLIAALNKESSLHPEYNGKKMAPEYYIKATGVKKVFLSLGVNDIHNTGNASQACENYKELISRIKEVNPEVKIHVLSTTYGDKSHKNGKKYSTGVKEFNELMRDYCNYTDVDFIDIASYLATSDDCLKSEYCSDGYVHLTYQAYGIWDKVLRNYAWKQHKLYPTVE